MFTTKERQLNFNTKKTLSKSDIDFQRRVIGFSGGINQ